MRSMSLDRAPPEQVTVDLLDGSFAMRSSIVGAWILTVTVVALFSSASAVRSAESPTGGDLDTMIANAKTPTDHKKIATYYDAAAADARQRAQEHGEREKAYKNLGGGAVAKWQLDRHCASLAKSAEAEAQEYEALAKSHREMAAAADEK
jgi:hypothetical protein